MLRVRLLRQFDVRLDDKPIELIPRAAQSLIAYLILNRGNSYRREKLAGMLWPASTEANSRNNLRQALWRRCGVSRRPHMPARTRRSPRKCPESLVGRQGEQAQLASKPWTLGSKEGFGD